MFNSSSASGGCLVGVLRRLFSSSFHHSHSHSHHIADETTSSDSDRNVQSPAPNLVARLMGLDSMPKLSLIHPHKSPNSAQIDQQQQQLKTFFSMPTFIDQENDHFLVLSFENVPKRLKKSRKKRNNQETDKEDGNSGTIVNSATISPPIYSKDSKKKKKKKMKVEAECSSEDSSPVSVLDFGPEEGSRSADSNSRRKLAPKLEEKCELKSPSNEKEAKESYMETWGFEESNWKYRKNCSFGDVGDVCRDVEVQLLDQLFHELVLELRQISIV